MDRDRNRYYNDRDRDWDWDREPDYPRDYERSRESDRRRAAPQGRKKKKKRSPLVNSALYILIVFGVSAILAVFAWSLANDMLALNKEETTAVVRVWDEDDFGSVSKQLKENDIINHRWLFSLFASFSGGKDRIAAGTYNLDTSMDYSAILSNLSDRSVNRVTTDVTIPEGYTIDQIFALLEEKGVSTVEKLQHMAATHDYAFSFLQDVPMGNYKRLEGYLFPDTYEFYMGEDPKYIINKMLVNFDAKLTDAYRQQVWDKGYSIGQMLTVASMIEKETDGTDRGKIASVIYNRLNNPGASTAGYLNIDATIQYVLPEGEIVNESHYTSVQDPYNTYLNKGLPPGPIANPGMESILAAINPDSTNYYYYALGDDGYHHFFNSRSEHLAFLNS